MDPSRRGEAKYGEEEAGSPPGEHAQESGYSAAATEPPRMLHLLDPEDQKAQSQTIACNLEKKK